MPATRSRWAADTTGPTSVSVRLGSPNGMAPTSATSAATTSSWMPGPAISRQAAVQSWPEL